MDYSSLTDQQIADLNSLTVNQIKAIHALVDLQEKSDAYDNGVLVSELLESAFAQAFIERADDHP